MTDAAVQRRQRLTGVALMCGAVMLFACLDSISKYLNTEMDSVMVVWSRYAGGFLLALIMSNPIGRPGLMRTSRLWLQFGRSLMLVTSSLGAVLALRWLQLDQVTAFMFSAPLLLAVLSGPMLGEWIGWRRWCAIGVGFIGVLVVTRVGYGGIHPAALFSFGAVFCYTLYLVMTRLLSRTDSSETTLFYSNMVGVVLLSAAVPFFWTTPKSAFIIALIVVSGALGSIGHYLLIMAHRLAPAAVLAPFLYTQLFWAITLGYLVFGNLPTQWTLAGSAIVVASGLYLLHREYVTGRRTVSESIIE